MKRIIIIGATSGIGLEVARCYLKAGWQVGVAGRREEELEKLRQSAPGQVCTQRIDVTREDAPALLEQLIMKTGGMDVFLLSSGIGKQKSFTLPRYRITDRSHQCFGIHTNGQCRLSLFRTARQRTYSGDQFHSRHQGTGIRPCLFSDQTVSKHLSGCFGPIGAHEQATHFLHRHPSRICRHPSVER